MKTMTRLTLVLGAAIMAAAPAQAALLDDYFGGGGSCYSRVYDRAHLASHPDQLVTEIHLGSSTIADPGFDGTLLEFGFTLRGGNRYSAVAYCERNGCGLEGDGGNFALARDGNALQLSVGDFLALEGARDFSPDLTESDDTVFLLYPSRASACM